VDDFVREVELRKEILEENLTTVLRDVGFAVAENLTIGGRYSVGTPIDTGYARASWWISLNGDSGPVQSSVNPDAKTAKKGDYVRNATGPDDAPKLVGAKLGDRIGIFSNCAYMRSLEFGHSQAQAPHGMIRLAFDGVRHMMSDAIAAARAARR
jgi:hypothetical protein